MVLFLSCPHSGCQSVSEVAGTAAEALGLQSEFALHPVASALCDPEQVPSLSLSPFVKQALDKVTSETLTQTVESHSSGSPQGHSLSTSP